MRTHLKLALAAMLASSTFMASAANAHTSADMPTSVTMPGTSAGAANNQAMSEQMQKMQAIHNKAAAAKTPAERQAAMQEGMQTIQDSLTMMSQHQSAAGCSGMGMGMSSGMGMSGSMGGMGMMDMMMQMLDQQSSMMNMPMHD